MLMYGMGINKDSLAKYIRAVNYLSVAQIFLKDNFLLERPLEAADIKPRLLGHWGTCPGINRVYAHLSAFIKAREIDDMMFILGPGHGFPALQANLYLEGTLGKFYEEAKDNLAGISYLCKNFSWPYGFPSHSNPGAPGVILEGGELGYSLSTAYGAVLDNPELIAACLIGDGEAETGSLLAALNLNKLIDPKNNGVVLPILHLNGYKITGPTIYGRMSDKELIDLFSGFGYRPLLVQADEDSDFTDQMESALNQSYEMIQNIKTNAKEGFCRLPFIIMRTAKGETGPTDFNGEKIAGNNLSHQVVFSNAKTNADERGALEEWLRSYRFDELYDKDSGFGHFIDDVMPDFERRMGVNKHAFGRKFVEDKLELPNIDSQKFSDVVPGESKLSSMAMVGDYLKDTFELNEDKRNFRFFCPDETASNKLDVLYGVTDRQWLRPLEVWDKNMSPSGRITEILSENTLQGLMQGYILTGRYGMLSSYEAFMPIITSMINQYVKFLDQSKNVEWRGKVASANYLLTSVGWRQDHNGFSHQNPGLISDLLLRPNCLANVFLPIDDMATLASVEFSLKTKGVVNVVTAGKTDEPRWIDFDHARFQIMNGGASMCRFASDEDPEIVIASAGDYVSKESLAAIAIIKSELPHVKIRYVNVAALCYGAIGTTENKLSKDGFRELFTDDKAVIFNFHGYTDTMKAILANYTSLDRVSVHGYMERGSTTTPFDMQVRNETDRYNLAMDAFGYLENNGIISREELGNLITKYQQKIAEHFEYIKLYGVDQSEIKEWKWQKNHD
jgi:Phosphoketolase